MINSLTKVSLNPLLFECLQLLKNSLMFSSPCRGVSHAFVGPAISLSICRIKTCYLGSERIRPLPDNHSAMYRNQLLLIAGLLWHAATFAQAKMPSLEEVASKFYNTYETGSTADLYTFEKRPGRWAVTVLEWKVDQMAPKESYLYFAADSGGYRLEPTSARSCYNFADRQPMVCRLTN